MAGDPFLSQPAGQFAKAAANEQPSAGQQSQSAMRPAAATQPHQTINRALAATPSASEDPFSTSAKSASPFPNSERTAGAPAAKTAALPHPVPKAVSENAFPDSPESDVPDEATPSTARLAQSEAAPFPETESPSTGSPFAESESLAKPEPMKVEVAASEEANPFADEPAASEAPAPKVAEKAARTVQAEAGPLDGDAPVTIEREGSRVAKSADTTPVPADDAWETPADPWQSRTGESSSEPAVAADEFRSADEDPFAVTKPQAQPQPLPGKSASVQRAGGDDNPFAEPEAREVPDESPGRVRFADSAIEQMGYNVEVSTARKPVANPPRPGHGPGSQWKARKPPTAPKRPTS